MHLGWSDERVLSSPKFYFSFFFFFQFSLFPHTHTLFSSFSFSFFSVWKQHKITSNHSKSFRHTQQNSILPFIRHDCRFAEKLFLLFFKFFFVHCMVCFLAFACRKSAGQSERERMNEREIVAQKSMGDSSADFNLKIFFLSFLPHSFKFVAVLTYLLHCHENKLKWVMFGWKATPTNG